MSYDRPTPAWIKRRAPGPKPYLRPKPLHPWLSPMAFHLIGGVVPGNLPVVTPFEFMSLQFHRQQWDRLWREATA